MREPEREARPVPLAPIDYLERMRRVSLVEAIPCGDLPADGTAYARGDSRVCLRKLRQLKGEDRDLPAKLDWARERDISRSRIDTPQQLLVYEYGDIVTQSHRAEALAQAGIGWSLLGQAAPGSSRFGRMLPIEDDSLDFADVLSRFNFSANPRMRLSDLTAGLSP